MLYKHKGSIDAAKHWHVCPQTKRFVETLKDRIIATLPAYAIDALQQEGKPNHSAIITTRKLLSNNVCLT